MRKITQSWRDGKQKCGGVDIVTYGAKNDKNKMGLQHYRPSKQLAPERCTEKLTRLCTSMLEKLDLTGDG